LPNKRLSTFYLFLIKKRLQFNVIIQRQYVDRVRVAEQEYLHHYDFWIKKNKEIRPGLTKLAS
jgi:hypothetical protein